MVHFYLHIIIVTLQFLLCLIFGLVGRFYECIFDIVEVLRILIVFTMTLPLYLAIDIARGIERYWIGKRAQTHSFSRVAACG